jgi:hypothetical protein
VVFQQRGLGLGRWGAHGHDTHACPPARIQHGAKTTEALRALDAWHGGAPRGGPRLDEHMYSTTIRSRERLLQWPGVAMVQGHNKGGAGRRPFMGKRRRTGARRLEGLPTGMEAR